MQEMLLRDKPTMIIETASIEIIERFEAIGYVHRN